MSTAHYDVAIVGLGAMGSMAAWQASARGLRVIGFDRFAPPHANGSSTGLSRIIRECYSEQRYYVPIVQRAYRLWAQLEAEAGRSVLTTTGGLLIGDRSGYIVAGAMASAQQFGLQAELLEAVQVADRFPAFRLPEGQVAVYEPRAGSLAPEDAIESALGVARTAGAELRYNEPVLDWESGERITVTTAQGRYTADRLILAAGAWMAKDLPKRSLPLAPNRQVLFWFEPNASKAWFELGRCPIFLWEWSPGRSIYGFPDQGHGFKVAVHHEGTRVDPDTVDRTVHEADEQAVRVILDQTFPGLIGPVVQSGVCLYTNTPDEDFILDFHPDDRRVVVASPCSGHGFKFAPAIGEILIDLVTRGQTAADISHFRIDRSFGRPSDG